MTDQGAEHKVGNAFYIRHFLVRVCVRVSCVLNGLQAVRLRGEEMLAVAVARLRGPVWHI